MMLRIRVKQKLVLVALAVAFLLGVTGLVLAQALDYALDWWTVDSGGGTWSSADGQYVLDGTAGQPDAGLLSGGDYVLASGFWGGGGAVQYRIYLPFVLK